MLLCGGALLSNPRSGSANDDNDNSGAQRKSVSETSQSTAPPGIVPAGAAPDLEITFAGFHAPGVNDQLIKLRIMNRGNAPSVETVARVVTSRPEPTPWFRELTVKALAPNESVEVFYPLSASCNGHLIRALVNLAGDSNESNNALEWEVCPPPIIVHTPPEVPSHLRPGTHALIFSPSGQQVFGKARHEGRPLAPLPYPRTGELEAGFYNGATTDTNYVWRAGFRFDLDLLRQARDTGRWLPTDALLTFQEIPHPHWVDYPGAAYHMQNPAADIVPTTTCWPHLAVPTIDWTVGKDGGLLPSEVIREAGAIGRWNVYDQILGMVVDPERAQRGFLIIGHSESMDDNYAACRSRIRDVKLTVTYTIS